jgi:hypothetical protein
MKMDMDLLLIKHQQ